MAFQETLNRVNQAVDSAYLTCLLDREGILVDSVQSEKSPPDLQAYLVQLLSLYPSLQEPHVELQVGPITDWVVASKGLTTIVRPLGPEYFLVTVLPAHANAAKARYYLRLIAPVIADEIA